MAREVAAARGAILGLFLVNGLTLSMWIARVPAVRDALGLDPAQLGAVLLAAAIGGLAATVLAPAAVTRLGLAPSVRTSGALFGAGYLAIGAGAALGWLPLVVVGLLLNGVAFSGGNLPLNLGSTDVERRMGRSVLPQFHAAFSIGTVAGSLLGAAAAALDVPLLVQFSVMAVVAVAWRWVAAGSLLPQEHAIREARPERGPSVAIEDARRRRVPARSARPAQRPARPGWLEPRTLLIGVVALAAALSEGSANDWLALGVVDGFGATQSVAAVTFGVFVGAMTLVRLVGAPVIDRFGRAAVLRTGAIVSIAGIVLLVTAPSLPLAVVGVAAWGAGAALNFPIAVSAASDDPRRAGLRVTVMSAFGGLAGLLGPVGLGALGQEVGVRSALLAVAVALLAIVAVAGAVARARAGIAAEVAPGALPGPGPSEPDDDGAAHPAAHADPARLATPATQAA